MATAPTPSPGASKQAARTVERFDLAGRLGKFERTPSGGLKIPAYIARTGVQLYRDGDGKERREYRPASEVFDEASYRSFEGAPITRKHPDELVSPDNWASIEKLGHVRNVRPDGERLAADLYVEDGRAIREIEAGELVETSAGYLATVEERDGEHGGERYDAVQLAIRGNHVGLGPKGWGRAGPEVRLRVDAAHQVINDSTPKRETRSDSMSTKRVRVDGIEYDAGSDSHLQAVERLVGKLETERDHQKKRADEAAAALETATKERDEAKEQVETLGSESEIDARVAKKLGLVQQVVGMLGEKYKWAGKTDRQLMGDALKKAGISLSEDDTPERVAAKFETLLALTSKAQKSAPAKSEGGANSDDSSGDDDTSSAGGDDGGSGGRGDGGFDFQIAPFQTPKKDATETPTVAQVMAPFESKWRR